MSSVWVVRRDWNREGYDQFVVVCGSRSAARATTRKLREHDKQKMREGWRPLYVYQIAKIAVIGEDEAERAEVVE